jgi:hypothetical protein
MTKQYDRLREWRSFSMLVELHITNYTLKQYGNPSGNEQIDSFTPEQIKSQLERYVNRIGKGARGPVEALRDCLKIAHYAQFLYDKLAAQEASNAKS